MRRYLTLVFMLFLVIPAGISFSGCTRNPAGNYCNGLGYGLKDTDVYGSTWSRRRRAFRWRSGRSSRSTHPPPHLQGSERKRIQLLIRHHEQPDLDIIPDGNICAGTWNRNSGGGIPDYTICNPPNPLPSTGGLPYSPLIFRRLRTRYLESSAGFCPCCSEFCRTCQSGVVAGAQQCYSQGTSTQLDSEACSASAANSMNSALRPRFRHYSCPEVADRSDFSSCCSNSIGALAYAVSTSTIATLNAQRT